MKIFCDTNVLIAGSLSKHPQHNSARPVLERIKAGTDEGWAATHSLAETYAVLTRLPGANHMAPGVAWQIISENIIKNFSLVALSSTEYSKVLGQAAASGIEGGKIYDALLLAAAVKSGAERIYTFNVTHFQNMADLALQKRITAP